MRIVMDFDGVFTNPSLEGDACQAQFRDKILSLGLKGLENASQLDSWMGELRARLASKPYLYGWRSEGRVSAFTFEDPFIRNIGLADFLDALVQQGDERAKMVLSHLVKKESISTFGELSEWAFHQLSVKKQADPGALAWVRAAIEKGHDVTIVSNSATDKIEDFLNQSGFGMTLRPKVLGNARKFGLGKQKNTILIARDSDFGEVNVDTDRPLYEQVLLEAQPDLIIGDVLSLDLALPVRLKRQGKLAFQHGIFYRLRDYTPSRFVDALSFQARSLVPEISLLREWSQLKL